MKNFCTSCLSITRTLRSLTERSLPERSLPERSYQSRGYHRAAYHKGASQIAKALGPDAAGITVALTVPAPNQQQIPVVQECADAWKAAGQSDAISVTALEACIAAKVLVEGMRRAGREVTRESLHKALFARGRVNAGGVAIAFRPEFRHGGICVDSAVIRLNSELRG